VRAHSARPAVQTHPSSEPSTRRGSAAHLFLDGTSARYAGAAHGRRH
jgi:hypothetical protein